MEFFIDSADIDDIKKANEMGLVDGVTTKLAKITNKPSKKFQTSLTDPFQLKHWVNRLMK